MVINDSLQRRQALNPTESYIVSAPAGSGKTGLLTQRYLKLLSTVRFPEEVLAITFTQKAASEMSRRIYECLEFAANNPRPESEFSAVNYDLAMDVLERSQKSGWHLLEMPNRLRVRTIDSFSRYIATQFSIEAGLLDISNPSEHPEPMYLESARSIITKLEDKNDPLHESIKTLVRLTGNNLNSLEMLLAEMLPTREQWLPIIYSAANNADYFISVINNLIKTRLESTEEKLLPIMGELIALTDYAAQTVDADKNPNLASLSGIEDSPASTAQDAHIWKTLATMLVTDKGTYRKSITKKQGFPTTGKEEKARMLSLVDYCTSIDGLEEALASLKDLPNPTLDTGQKQTLDALAELLPALAAELNVVFTKYNTCDFASITLSALNAMQQHDNNVSDITMRLDYNLKHILIDEFQDTSSAQIKLVASLVEGWIPGDGRTLFIVGDAMQSLYSFRNANVSLFANAQKYPIGPIQCKPLALSTNFRSEQGIVDWVNTSFTKAFPVETDVNRGGIPYSPAVSIKKNTQEEKSVNFVGFTGNGYEEAEAKVVADTCKTIIDKNPGDSIAILIKSRSHLKEIVPQLLQKKLHWDALNIDPLESRMPVQDILSLTKALSSVADRISWLALLRAPTVGLTLDDIIKITNSTKQSKYTGDAVLEQLIGVTNNEHDADISPRGRQILNRAVPILIEAYKQSGRNSLRNLVEKTWLDLGGANTLNENENKDVRQILELIEKHEEAAKIRDWSNFELAIKKLFGQPSSDTDKNDTPAIQIMTIHASKGLEFDHVILPGLSRTSGKSSKTLMQWHLSSNEENESSLLIAPAGAHDMDESDLYEYLRKEKSAREVLEQTRLMYVATTRAVKSLTMTAKLKPKGESFEKPASSLSIARIWPGLVGELEAGSYSVIETGGADDKQDSGSSLLLKALPHALNRPATTKAASKSLINEVKLYVVDNNKKARGLGTIQHSWIQQICTKGVDWFNELSVDVFKRMTEMKLKEMGIIATSKDLDIVHLATLGMTTDKNTRALMGKITDVEVEIFTREPGESAKKLIVDASYIEDGTRVIIDWKTSIAHEGENEDDFLSRETERYRQKMTEYAAAYQKIDSGLAKIKAKLFFVNSRKLVEIEEFSNALESGTLNEACAHMVGERRALKWTQETITAEV